ncbi:MAG: DUF523 domain-containing protein [Nitrospirota bacterium]
MDKIKIGISSCLLGEKVRYDGGHKLDRYITETLGKYFDWISVCPEVGYGLPVPRESMRLAGEPDSPRLVTVNTKVDHTEGMMEWTKKKLRKLEKEELCGFIFKSKSPSCGIGCVTVYMPSGMPGRQGLGVFAGNFIQRFPFIPVIDEGDLQDPELRGNFLRNIFVYGGFLFQRSRSSDQGAFSR